MNVKHMVVTVQSVRIQILLITKKVVNVMIWLLVVQIQMLITITQMLILMMAVVSMMAVQQVLFLVVQNKISLMKNVHLVDGLVMAYVMVIQKHGV